MSSILSAHPAGTTFCFAPGTYRLTSPIDPEDGDKLVGSDGAVLTGARVLSGWTQSGSVWSASIGDIPARTTDWSGDSLLHPQAVYEHDLFLGSRTLTKVGVMDGGSVRGKPASSVGPGEYFVDYDADRVILGSDPAGKSAELSVTPAGIESSADGVTVAGLIVEKFAGPGIESAGGERWAILRNEIRFNHTRALKVYGHGVVRNNWIHHNGQYGLTGTGDGNVFEGNEVAFNNWARYARSTSSFWDAGGTKFVRNTNLIVRNNNVHDNFGDGIWVDIDNSNVTIAGNTVENNSRIGINYEINGSGSIEGNTVSDNGYVGIWVNSSHNVKVTGNTVARNEHSIVVVDQDRGAEYTVRAVAVTGNTIINSGVTGTRETTGATFEGNTYKVSSLGSELWQWNSETMDAASWRGDGHDTRGTFIRM